MTLERNSFLFGFGYILVKFDPFFHGNLFSSVQLNQFVCLLWLFFFCFHSLILSYRSLLTHRSGFNIHVFFVSLSFFRRMWLVQTSDFIWFVRIFGIFRRAKILFGIVFHTESSCIIQTGENMRLVQAYTSCG